MHFPLKIYSNDNRQEKFCNQHAMDLQNSTPNINREHGLKILVGLIDLFLLHNG